MKRISNYVFSRVPSVIRPRSKFDKGRTYKTTFDAGYLIPFFVEDILPGDTMQLNLTAFARMATLIVPYMDNVWMDFQFFFCPNRLVWENWQRFCGEQDNPSDSTDYLVPQVNVTPTVGSLWDYLGLPVGKNLTVDALVPRMCNLIWNSWYRDENLQNSVVVDVDDGPDTASDYVLMKRGKRKSDAFTSALPWPQKGPGVELSLSSSYAPVGVPTMTSGGLDKFNQFVVGNGLGSSPVTISASGRAITGSGATPPIVGGFVGVGANASFQPTGYASSNTGAGLYADLSAATTVTINSMREAFQIQKWYEQLARGGSRYVELCLSMFGVHTGDARLQRPEYLGGGTVPINVHAVAQTSATGIASEDTPQGNLSAYAVAGANGIGFSKSFVEHGYVLGFVSVRADYNYQQGLDRHWSRRTKFDFYWPAFAHLGEVPILNKEIYYQNNASVDNAAFGYQERWYEYRYGVNKITGKLRSGVPFSLDVWHLAQYFDNLPTLSSQFIEENPPLDRVIAVQNEPQFIFDSVIKCYMSRVMPVYSTPGLVDHF